MHTLKVENNIIQLEYNILFTDFYSYHVVHSYSQELLDEKLLIYLDTIIL